MRKLLALIALVAIIALTLIQFGPQIAFGTNRSAQVTPVPEGANARAAPASALKESHHG
jgi:hypothetical protein